jgi:hypothetical protein
MKIDNDVVSKLVLVYRDYLCGTESLNGYITNTNNEYLEIFKMNTEGIYDGYSIVRKSDITRIRWNNEEYKLIEMKNDQLRVVKSKMIGIPENIDEIVNEINRLYGYVDLQFEEYSNQLCIIGNVERIGDAFIDINEYCPLSSKGRSNIRIQKKDITRIDYDGIYERGLLRVYV